MCGLRVNIVKSYLYKKSGVFSAWLQANAFTSWNTFEFPNRERILLLHIPGNIELPDNYRSSQQTRERNVGPKQREGKGEKLTGMSTPMHQCWLFSDVWFFSFLLVTSEVSANLSPLLR